jgi:F-type H+-transporting ATPase subunit a
MPEHTSFFTYLTAWLFGVFPAFKENIANMKHVVAFYILGNERDKVEPLHTGEPLVASLFVVLLITVLAYAVAPRIRKVDDAVIPEAKLTLRTFFEAFIGVFYAMMVDMMGPKRAKRYFPIIGTSALFIFFSNVMGLVPGFNPPTSTWNITAGCALVIFVSFNYYGIKENGFGYFKHLCGPWLGPAGIPLNILIFFVEVLSLCFRPVTLSIRLMLNMAVDHLLGAIVFGMISLLVPIPIMILGTLVCVVQVFVFCLLSSIYIALATEHEDHGEEHAYAKAHAPHGEEHAASAHPA